MYIKNAAAAARANVSVKTLARWDKRYEEVRYPRPVFILGQIYRKLSEIEAWERNNPDFNPRGKKKLPQPNLAPSPMGKKSRTPERNQLSD